MNHHNYCWVFKKGLPERICDDIIKYGDIRKNEEIIGTTGDIKERDFIKNPLSEKEIKKLYKLRKSNIVWMNDYWVIKEIQPFINIANSEAGWNYQWDFSETCQYTIYNKGGYYDWHCDSWPAPYKDEGPKKGKVRKLSVTVCLSDENEYEGGDLQFDYRDLHPDAPRKISTMGKLSKGSVVVFPSWVWHRVTKLKKGCRKSLVVWNIGWPYK